MSEIKKQIERINEINKIIKNKLPNLLLAVVKLSDEPHIKNSPQGFGTFYIVVQCLQTLEEKGVITFNK